MARSCSAAASAAGPGGMRSLAAVRSGGAVAGQDELLEGDHVAVVAGPSPSAAVGCELVAGDHGPAAGGDIDAAHRVRWDTVTWAQPARVGRSRFPRRHSSACADTTRVPRRSSRERHRRHWREWFAFGDREHGWRRRRRTGRSRARPAPGRTSSSEAWACSTVMSSRVRHQRWAACDKMASRPRLAVSHRGGQDRDLDGQAATAANVAVTLPSRVASGTGRSATSSSAHPACGWSVRAS